MRKITSFGFLLAIGASTTLAIEPVKNRSTLCSLEFGRYADGVYVGSTPMEDACRTEHRESREKICKKNYNRPEIINACMLTYDGISEQIKKAEIN
jgi:hypothetical protein